jgi:hypothetical protein
MKKYIVLLFISCKKNHSKEFLFSKTDNSNFYEIHYFKNKIILINHSFVDNVKLSHAHYQIKYPLVYLQ